MPKSKHRRKGKTRMRPLRMRGNAGSFFIPDERGDCIAERCEQLYGLRPDAGYTDEQLIAAERQLENEGVIPRARDVPPEQPPANA
jgi:hypothetical protein